ncbi:MAG: heavy metal translocating P-type ATPase [Bacilli bacterium]|nr:heavy metal translocating P-type ATPase [Bacilli bacterium]
MKNNEKYLVSGMTCAACSAHVDKAVRGLEGVKEVSVNLLTNSMLVTYDSPCTSEKISEAVSKAGYGAKLAANPAQNTQNETSLDDDLKDRETPKLVKRLIASIILLIPLFYISMGYMVGWPLGEFGKNPFYVAFTEMIISLTIMIINHKFFVNGIKSLFHGGGSMDTLVAFGSGIAFIYSMVMLYFMGGAAMSGDHDAIMRYSMNISFETAGMVPTLITIGKTLESYSKGKTTNALKSLIKLAPKTAHVIRDGVESDIDAKDVHIDDIFIVRPGESFPVDGVVIEGVSAVNESALTGESMPVDKEVGSSVFTATINQNGALTCKATKIGQDTVLNQIIDMVKTAAGTKTKISQLADKVSAVFVPVVLSVAIIVLIFWLILGSDFVASLNNGTTLVSYSIERAIAVLVISCPCALGLATPVAIMVGSGLGAKKGILFKTASSLEETGKIDFAVFDKTGTITKGKPVVTDYLHDESLSDEEFIKIASSLESKSEHPLALAIKEKAAEMGISLMEISDFQALPGMGLKTEINGKTYLAGNLKLMEENHLAKDKYSELALKFASEGKTSLYFADEKAILGIIAVRDEIKEDSKEAIAQFEKLGVKTIMLTGDNKVTAEAIAKEVGVSHVVSDVLPDGKLAIIEILKKHGRVMMVGDGINDAPALMSADIGVAIGAGSDIAIDSASLILMKSSLLDAVAAYRLSKQTLKNIKENLFWAFFYNLIMIPIAAGAFSALGLAKLKPWMGAAAMSLSSFFVVMNALRLNLYNPYSTKHDHNRKKEIDMSFLDEALAPKCDESCSYQNEESVYYEIDVEGMMCEHCVAHVKKALESVSLDATVNVSLEENKATYKNVHYVKEEDLASAIKEAGYTVKSIKKGEDKMKVTLKIEGMMCEHCVAHVKKALEGVAGVESAIVSLKDDNAVVEGASFDAEALKKAVVDAGYEVKGIE